MALVLLVRPQGLFGIKYSDVSVPSRRDHRRGRPRCGRASPGWWRCWRLLALPFAVSDYSRALVAEIFIFAIFAMSLDLLLGFTGLMSLGHAAFFGLGAYARRGAGDDVRRSMPGSALAAGGSRWPPSPPALIGWFCVRTGGVTFLMLTLAFSQLVFSVALKWRDVTGGSDGLAIAEKPSFFGFDLSNSLVMYYMALIFFVLVFGLCAG